MNGKSLTINENDKNSNYSKTRDFNPLKTDPGKLECYKMCSIFSQLTSPSASQALVIDLRIQPVLVATAELVQRTSSVTPGSTMKLHQVAIVAWCVVLLVASEAMVSRTSAAGCNIVQLAPCIAASKDAKVTPSKQCCANVASMGKGLSGAKCLCSLLSHPLAKSQRVVPRIALAIPQKCRIAVPKGFVCQGIRVPGS